MVSPEPQHRVDSIDHQFTASDKMFRRLSPVTEPNGESRGRPNTAPLSQILQEPSPQTHAAPLSRILASQSPLPQVPVNHDRGLHAAPLSQILASPSPLLQRPPGPLLQHPPASPSPLLHHPPASPSPLLQRPPALSSPLFQHPQASSSPSLQRPPGPLLHRPPASPSPLLQRRPTTPVRQNPRRSRTPPAPAQIPRRGPKRKAAADLKVNPDQLYVKTQKRHRYTNRHKAQVLSFWLEPTPHVARPGPRGPGEGQHRTLTEVAEHTKIPLGTVKQWALKKYREKIFSTRAGLRCVQRGKAKWPRLERRLYGQFLTLRERAHAVRLSWFSVTGALWFAAVSLTTGTVIRDERDE
jgi:hypothetical protein